MAPTIHITHEKSMAIVQANLKYAPKFTDGVFTLTFAADAVRAGLKYAKRIGGDPADITADLVDNFDSFTVRDFARGIDAQIKAGMPFDAFIEALRVFFFGSNWHEELGQDVAAIRMSPTESFADFHLRIRRPNTFLAGTPDFKDDAAMKKLITGAVLPELADLIKDDKANLATKATIGEWCVAVEALDDKRNKIITAVDAAAVAAVQRLLAAQRGKENARPRPSSSAASSSSAPPAKRARTSPTPAGSGTKAAPDATVRIAKLTDEERGLLIAHDGCFRCRQFYAGHKGAQKVCDLPDRNKIPVINATTAAAAAAAHAKATSSKAVNIVYASESDSFSDDDTDSSDLGSRAGGVGLFTPVNRARRSTHRSPRPPTCVKTI